MAAISLRDRIRGSADIPARWALRLTNTSPMRRVLAARYRKAIEANLAALPALSALDAEIVAAIERDGVYITTLEALGLAGSAEMLAATQRLGDDFTDEARKIVKGGTDFTIVPPAAVAAQPAVFAWGLQERLLDIAEAYLRVPVAYDGVNIIYTVADGRAVATRQWHRDWEDRRMVKVAVYCNDVGAGGGPLQILSRHDETQDDAAGYFYDPATPDELARLFGPEYAKDVVSCTGPAGTVIFTDTARYFHRGQPAVTADRKAVFFSYFARTPRHPFFCERSGMTRGQIAGLAKGLTARQRATVMWRETLPALVRMIPPARL